MADHRVVITALGIAQILAWGTSFYFPAVFAGPIIAETDWPLGAVVGGASVGLLVAGLISPQVGRLIDLHGGRPVLMASSVFYATGLAGIAMAPVVPVYLAAWALVGVGMGTGLYDAVFRHPWQALWPRGARADHQSDPIRRLLEYNLLASERLFDRARRLAPGLLDLCWNASFHRAAATDGGDRSRAAFGYQSHGTSRAAD